MARRLKLGRLAVAVLGWITLGLSGVTRPAFASDPPSVSSCEPVSVATILASPERYGEREVRVRGQVVNKTRAVFPNGRPYFTLSLGDGPQTLTVFSWVDPSVKPGDPVDVLGVFHLWRYNLKYVVESRRIARVESAGPTAPDCKGRVPG